MEAVREPEAVDGVKSIDVVIDVVQVEREQLPTQERGRLTVVYGRFKAPGQSRGDQLAGRHVCAGKIVSGREGVRAHPARRRGEKEADGKSTSFVSRRGPRETSSGGAWNSLRTSPLPVRHRAQVRRRSGSVRAPPRYPSANSAPSTNSSAGPGRATPWRASDPVSRRPYSRRSSLSGAGNRPPRARPPKVEGVPQNTESRS
jgi:hypothetical protein